MNTKNNSNNNRNNTLDQVLTQAVKECTNAVKFEDLEILETRNLTEELEAAKAQVEKLEAIIAECESMKAKAQEEEKKEKEAEQEFINSLTFPGKEVLSYLEGLKTLAQGDQLTMVDAIIKAFLKYDNKKELVFAANIAAYVAILVREEKKEVIDILEAITIKVYNVTIANKGSAGGRVEGLDRILRAVQDIY